MFELIPPKSNKKAQKLVILFFVCAAAMLFISALLRGLPFVWAVQLFALILLTASIFVITRYIMKVYIYRVESTDSGADLTVTETSANGKNRITVCRLSLASIKECHVLEGEECSLRAVRREKKKVFDYRPDLLPDKSLLILSDEGGEECYVCLSYDDTLYGILSTQERNEE